MIPPPQVEVVVAVVFIQKQQKNSNKCNKRFSSSLALFSFIMSTNFTIYKDKLAVPNNVVLLVFHIRFKSSQLVKYNGH